MKKWFIIISAFVLIVACQEQIIEQHPTVYDYGYFPLDSGMWKQYNVTSIVIDEPSQVWDTAKYQLREVFAGWILDATNDSVMRIKRFFRDSVHHSWSVLSVWQVDIKGNDILQTEENIKFLKIKFPTKLNSDWNGNIYNSQDSLNEYRYTITSVDIIGSVNELVFDSILTITQKDKTSIIDKIYFFEKYAYGVGLIEKQQIDIYSEDVDPSIPIEKRVTKGTMYYQKITSYGKN